MRNNITYVTFDEITRDDYDSNGFLVNNYIYDDRPTNHPEGYYYECAHEIPIRTFSRTVNESSPTYYQIVSIEENDDNTYSFTTSEENYINKSSNVYLYDSIALKSYKCKIINVLSEIKLSLSVFDNNNSISLSASNIDRYKLYTRDETIPSYATYIGDGCLLYRWRDVIQNGFEDVSDLVEEYPFTNGCLYVNKQINIFLRRQDPFGYNGLFVEPNIQTPILLGSVDPVENGTSESADDSISENEAIC
jgi:hypothetical protein